MNIRSLLFSWIIFIFHLSSFCHCILRRKCQVLEPKYFEPYMQVEFDECGDFDFLNATVAVNCNRVENFNDSLAEVPVDTDWLCLKNFMGAKIDADTFTRLTNLQYLYITGNFELLPGVFAGLSQLSTLWIESEKVSDTIIFYYDTFDGLRNLRELKLINIHISVLDTSVFNHLLCLEHLILEGNKIRFLSTVTKSLGNIQTLRKLAIINNDISILREEDCLRSENPAINGPFVNFNVSILELSSNILQIIENNSLCNFPHLSVFIAHKTGINITQLFQSGIKAIETLSVTYADFVKLCEYSSNFKIKDLSVRNNQICEIITGRGTCKNLEKIDLSNNLLQNVNFKQMKRLKHLIYLDASSNKIRQLNICPKPNTNGFVMKLEHLNLSYNSLTFLAEGQFNCLENLQVLSLENNKISIIEDSAFFGSFLLQVLNLQNNNIFEITDLTFYGLFILRSLNLNENVLTSITYAGLAKLNQIEEIKLTLKDYLDGLWMLQYISNTVKHISIKMGDNLIQLVSEQFNMLNELETLEIESKDIHVDSCEEFVFSGIKEMYFRNNMYFVCFDSLDQALGKFTNLEKLYYDANSLAYDSTLTINSSLQYLTKLKFLRIENTAMIIGRYPMDLSTMFNGLSDLKMLHLKNAGLDHFDSPALFTDLRSLEFLLVENANVQGLTEYALKSMPNLKYVYFHETVFPCSCRFNGLMSWLKYDTQVSIVNFSEQDCLLDSANVNMIDFLLKNCQDDIDFKIFIATFPSILLFMIVSLFHESIWWNILYLYYKIKCWLTYRLRGGDNNPYQFDVFVSYNTCDEQWVVDQLLLNLEHKGPPFFRVCIHNRDFEIGKAIVENIVDSIYKSRWTICIITRSYLQSHWCSLEMRMAIYRLIAESKDSLILIFLDKITREELKYYHRLSKLMDTKTYLEWPEDNNGQELFWVRLRKVIGGHLEIQQPNCCNEE
uniref:TIR domain-containing protein n=1 Tax=Leptobrachium leishanense TaxID=445787 RepID=A0A8C5N0U1_9ANUR